MKNPNSSLNIALVSSSDIAGGASRSSYRLYKGLLDSHASVRYLVKNKSIDHHPGIIKIPLESPQFQLDSMIATHIEKELIVRNRGSFSTNMFSLPYPGFDLSSHPSVLNAHVINLHWVSYFQSVETISRLAALHKPIILTLHDQSPFTGGCHYSAGCTRYRNDCHPCPLLADQSVSLPREILYNKKQYIPANLTIVSPSRWLAQSAAESLLFRDLRIEVIPYGIETDIFKPLSQNESRDSFNIPRDAVVILFGAISTGDTRKGFHLLKAALTHCNTDLRFRKNARKGKLVFVTFGNPQQELYHLDIPCIQVGRISDDHTLARLYSAADMFLLPSLEDNLPNTMVESLSCGTPVLGFDTGGVPDMVKHRETGLLAPLKDSRKLGENIIDLVFNPSLRRKMARLSRKMIEEGYRLNIQANAYIALFQELMKQHPSSPVKTARTKKKKKNKPGDDTPLLHSWQPIAGERIKPLFYQYMENLPADRKIDFYFLLGDLHKENHNQLYKNSYEKSLQILSGLEHPSDTHIYKIASLYRRLGQLENAAIYFRQLADRTADDHLLSGANFHLGEIALKVSGNEHGKKGIESAARFFSRCLQVNPRHTMARRKLMQIQVRQWPLESFHGKTIVLWGCSDAGHHIVESLTDRKINIDLFLDNTKKGRFAGKKIYRAEAIDFNTVDIILFGMLRDISPLKENIHRKFPHIKLYQASLFLDIPSLAGNGKIFDHVLTTEEIKEFRADFYPKRSASWIVKKEFMLNAGKPDMRRAIRAVRDKAFTAFSYGDDYNRLILDTISALPKESATPRAADVGCVSGLFPAMLLENGYKATIFDVRPIQVESPGLDSVQVDLCNTPIPVQYRERYDLVTSISTVEHVGLGRYGDPIDPRGDFKLVNGIRHILKTGGFFICSVPTGPGCVVYNCHRVYSRRRLEKLFAGFRLMETKTAYNDRSEFILGDDRYQPVFILRKVN